ncbi:MAG: hypothetical protein J0I41_17160 [Filimonas sp.]|nr:hypothetical protein [Filimonas sp.]
MLLVNTTKRIGFLAIALCLTLSLTAQINSPYSRYGLGDLIPAQPAASRGMGGISAPFVDIQALNTSNPASYGSIGIVTYDLGVTIDTRTMRSVAPEGKYKSTAFIPAYLQIGVPINRTRHIGAVLGIRPVTNINYSLMTGGRNPNASNDSINVLYEGNGGLNEIFAGLGKKWGNFAVGFNAGYSFGKKDISTKVLPYNDSLTYYKGNSYSTTSFNSPFIDLGVQYEFPLSKIDDKENKTTTTYSLRIGANAKLQQKLNATSNITNETFEYTNSGDTMRVDSVYKTATAKGKIDIPVSYRAGVMFLKTYSNSYGMTATHWGIGAEYENTQWSKYSYFGVKDPSLVNSWVVRLGGQITPEPDPIRAHSFWGRSTYKAGFYAGQDYINADGNKTKVMAFTFGIGFDLRKPNYIQQYTKINTAFEFGKRGSNVNNVTENFFKFTVGLSLSDVWFIKRKYD